MTLQVISTRTAEADSERGLHLFIDNAFKSKMPRLIPFVYSNESVLKLARQLKRSDCSPRTLYQYVFGIHRFCDWAQKKPDQIIDECFGPDGEQLTKAIALHKVVLSDFVDTLQDEGLAPGTINNHVKGVKQIYRANGIHIELPFRLSKKVKFKDRSPTAEELQKLIDIADLRGKVIVSLLATGGFRVGTLCQLQYRHVKHDLESIIPLHVHVEADIVKGHYADYDTFLPAETVEYLKLYLEERRRGSVWRATEQTAHYKIPPEVITDTSPLIRDSHAKHSIRSITPGRVHDIIHNLYLKTGILEKTSEPRYSLRAHSIRKYFKTELMGKHVQPDYIDSMMGHVVDTYHDVQMKGVEFLRGIYAASGLGIRPKTQVSKIEMLKQVAKAWGLDPERILTEEAQAYPHRTHASPVEREEGHGRTLAEALKQAVKKDLLAGE